MDSVVKSKKGNYMVFFPSYKLMEDVYTIYIEEFHHEDRMCICQNPHMGEQEREEFLQQFEAEREDSLVGFCVLGGIFAEGIDLIGDSLIGALIVGTGIPQISYEREILKNYYDARDGSGFDYAYRFSGMNKVLQAAGRVIRTHGDEGVILLLDERFLYREYLQLFPREWTDYQVCDLDGIEQKLMDFWN